MSKKISEELSKAAKEYLEIFETIGKYADINLEHKKKREELTEKCKAGLLEPGDVVRKVGALNNERAIKTNEALGGFGTTLKMLSRLQKIDPLLKKWAKDNGLGEMPLAVYADKIIEAAQK
ncbi:MAG: hypothetical protein NT116_01785 [Candidatus Parcubacteria bacterium]|nr:hypothetical protein [Candidatus Parcubacteria bacterium]